MLLSQRPEPKRLGRPFVFEFPSSSRPYLMHHVFVYPDKRGVQCTCEGWRTHGSCWHISRVPAVHSLLYEWEYPPADLYDDIEHTDQADNSSMPNETIDPVVSLHE